MSISRRLMVSTVALVVATALVIAVVAARATTASLLPGELQRQSLLANRLATALQGRVDEVRADVLTAVGALPNPQLLLGEEASDQATTDAARALAVRLFRAMLESKPDYLQIRFIGVARDGREVVRVDRSRGGDPVEVVPEAQLQTKGDRDYFRQGLRAGAGGVYVSPVELNQEHGAIQVPHVSVLRAAAPVLSANGEPLGVVVINVDLGEPFARLRAVVGVTYLVDEAGDYLVHPDPTREFEVALGRGRGLAGDDVELAAVARNGTPYAGELIVAGRKQVVASVPVTLAGGPRVHLILLSPSETLPTLAGIRRSTLAAFALAALISGLAALLLARSVVRPLRRMTEGAEHFPDAGEVVWPTKTSGEVGVLARAMERAQHRVHEQTSAVERQERTFRRVVEAAPSAMLMVDPNRRIVLVNRRTEQLFGYDRRELLGETVDKLVPLPQRDTHAGHVAGFWDHAEERAMGKGRDLFALAKDGRLIPVEIGLNPIETPDGPFVLTSVIDITDRKRAGEAQARLAAIVQSSEDAIIGKTLDDIITSWNGGAERLYGYPADEAVGHSILMVVPERLAQEESDIMARVARGEPVEHFETKRRRKDGTEVDVSIALSPIRDASGQIVGASKIARDITDLKRRDAELKRSNAELEQFAYVASHDLQEPLRMVANYTELLAERYRGKLDERADKYIHYASDGARRMQRLVSDLLAYSRVGSQGKPLLVVSAATIVESVVDSMQKLVKDNDATVEVGPLPFVLGDEVQLRQLFQNLIGNAIKFRSAAPPHVVVSAVRETLGWYFSVADNGIGLDMKYADRIFQMFQRLHGVGEYSGSGIGLAIAKRIVERHQGRIWVESKVGAGTTFQFTLLPVPRDFPAMNDGATRDGQAPVGPSGDSPNPVDRSGA